MKFLVLVFTVFLLAASAHAQTITSSSGGGTVTLTIDTVAVNTTTRTVSVTFTVTWASVTYRRASAWMGTGSGTGITLTPQNGSGTTTQTRNYTYPVGGTVTVNFGTFLYEPVGDNAQFAHQSGSLVRPAADAPQTITLTPNTSAVKQGKTVTFTAAGGHNGYLWSLSGGGGLVETGGALAQFTASTVGTFTIQVRNASGNGWLESNIATASVTVSQQDKVKAVLPQNKGTRPVEYMMTQGGVTLGTWVQMPGAFPWTVEVEAESTPSPELFSRVVGLMRDDDTGVWNAVTGAFSPWAKVATLPPSPAPPAVTVNTPNAPNVASAIEGDQSKKGVWTNATTTNSTSNVTNSVFVEGTDKTMGGLQDIKEALTGGAELSEPEMEEHDTDTADFTAATITGVGDKMPTAPVITPPSGFSSTIQFTFAVPRLRNTPLVTEVSWDAAPYEPQINVIRAMGSGCIAIIFFFIYVRTIRGAFAAS